MWLKREREKEREREREREKERGEGEGEREQTEACYSKSMLTYHIHKLETKIIKMQLKVCRKQEFLEKGTDIVTS